MKAMQAGNEVLLMVPVGPLRTEPSDRAELCTQALAGESARVLELGEKDWMRIQLDADGYAGWVDRKQWQLRPTHGGHSFQLQAPSSRWLRSDGAVVEFPAGARLTCEADGEWSLNGVGLEPVDALGRTLEPAGNGVDVAEQFLGAPYLWGGKTVYGIDCSGLVQLAWQLTGHQVPRDASEQALVGEAVLPGQELRGDLAFFENESGRVIHVGVLLDPHTILHAAGEVRIDAFTEDGIVRDDQLTHRRHSVRRW